jgi:excisionase family DNA binding protein
MTTKLLNVNQVSEILGLKPARVYELTRENCLPFVLLGERQYRYSETAIENYINRGGNQVQSKEGTENDERN